MSIPKEHYHGHRSTHTDFNGLTSCDFGTSECVGTAGGGNICHGNSSGCGRRRSHSRCAVVGAIVAAAIVGAIVAAAIVGAIVAAAIVGAIVAAAIVGATVVAADEQLVKTRAASKIHMTKCVLSFYFFSFI